MGNGQADGEAEEGPDMDKEVHDDSEVFQGGQEDGEEEEDDGTDNAQPLHFFYDCETTGLSIYSEHLTEIAAKVVGVPLTQVTQSSYSSLIHTPRNIPKKGNYFQ